MLCFSACLVFTSCDKDKDNENPAGGAVSKIEGTVVNGSDYDVDNIKAMVYEIINVGDGDEGYWYSERVEIASSNFTNNRFSLDLPATLDDKYLEFIFDDEMDLSDEEAKGTFMNLFGYKSNERVEYLEYSRMPDISATKITFYYSAYIYMDRDVKVTGEYSDEDGDTEKFNMNLKKGWNLMYGTNVYDLVSDVEIATFTTTPISGYKWYFDAEDYFEEHFDMKSASLKSSPIANNKSKMFQRLKK
jgi:hypothetical protein